jgi:peptidoglycan/LPS O-acetylase OafA/YrhL
LFRILAIPVLLYGQIFWSANFGAFNYFSLFESVYETASAKLAIFGYYLPDIFLFMSGFLLTRRLLSGGYGTLLGEIWHKLVRLYPLYAVTVAIYWGVSPALHAGPVWYVYQQEAQFCRRGWWRVLLLIDNFFSESCYPALWFVQVEMQCTVFVVLMFFSLYFSRPKLSYFLLAVYLAADYVLLFVLSAEMPVSTVIMV